MKYSKQREMIIRTLDGNTSHPTADAVYEELRKELPNISLGTVYRNLKQLVEQGEIRSLNGLDGKTHYDYNVEQHYHFICRKCNKVYDVSKTVAQNIKTEVFGQTGMEVEDCDIMLKGLCRNCQKQQ